MFPISRDPPEGGTCGCGDPGCFLKRFPISRDPPEGGTTTTTMAVSKLRGGNVISGNHFVQTTSSQGTTIGRDRRGNHWLHHFVQWHRLHWQGQNPHLYHFAQCAYLRRTQPLTVNLLSANCREGQVTGKTSCIR